MDEVCNRWEPRDSGIAALVRDGERVSLTDIVREEAASGLLRLHTEDALAEPNGAWGNFSFVWQDGTLAEATAANRPRIGVHFVHLKRRSGFVVDRWDPPPGAFYVTPTGTTTVPPEARARRLVHDIGRHVLGLPLAVRYSITRGAHWLRRRLSRQV